MSLRVRPRVKVLSLMLKAWLKDNIICTSVKVKLANDKVKRKSFETVAVQHFKF